MFRSIVGQVVRRKLEDENFEIECSRKMHSIQSTVKVTERKSRLPERMQPKPSIFLKALNAANASVSGKRIYGNILTFFKCSKFVTSGAWKWTKIHEITVKSAVGFKSSIIQKARHSFSKILYESVYTICYSMYYVHILGRLGNMRILYSVFYHFIKL